MESFVNLETIQIAFPDIDIIFIKNIVLEILSEYRYFINDYSLSNLVLHIAIAADRIKNNAGYGEYEQTMGTLNLLPHEYELSQKIVERLEEHFRLKFSAGEVQEMTLLLVSRATSLNYNSITVDNLADIIGKDCIDLVYELVNAIGSYYYINLNEPEFLIRFALHIKNLLIRAQNEHFCKNPLGDTLKATCPLIYDDAVCCSSIIKDWTGISINDDEISYIAFHLGSTLETQKALASKLSAVIYCPTYYNMGNRLLENICTVPINRSLVTPFVQVQPFLMESDVIAIRQKINEIRTSKKRETFTSYLHQIILPDFFERGEGFPDQEEAIHYLCEKFRQKGYVEEQFETEVLEREEMSSTGFQNFAIPHSMRMRAKKTGMYLYLCDTPTNWNGMPVYLIIMLCFNRDDRYIFNEIFEPLTMILTEPNNLKKALTFHEYDEFIAFLSGRL
ncbi:transcription antiterminator [Bacteroides caecimuris]|uniref:BglG family transcription antiterminator n=1 Tax=Bacteroides caecimuris TaxID=1796613 RepID=UPI0026F35380|nr:PRD domain-containing protein [Bacteroides caecimuris]